MQDNFEKFWTNLAYKKFMTNLGKLKKKVGWILNKIKSHKNFGEIKKKT